MCDERLVFRLCRGMLGALCLVLAAGCGSGLCPVEGRLLLKGEPLKVKEGAVVLKPDAGRGNKSSVSAVGTIELDGSFTIQNNGEPGVKPGWYKVIVLAMEPGANPNEDFRRVVDRRYETEATTPLAIEVMANPAPGSYDLQLSR